jgi:hypothetical protein
MTKHKYVYVYIALLLLHQFGGHIKKSKIERYMMKDIKLDFFLIDQPFCQLTSDSTIFLIERNG